MKAIILAVLLTMVSTASFAKEKDEKINRKPASINNNVMYGGDENSDACGGYGIVLATTTLMTMKNGKMSFGKVDINTDVYACDSSSDGEFIGIVFGKPGQSCGTGETVKTKQEYKGPCKSGWIKKSFFELLAG